MAFRIGQKVVCVDGSEGSPLWAGKTRPRRGEIYTIRATRISIDDGYTPVVLVREITNPICAWSGLEADIRATRFRPLVEKKTDISIFTEMLNPKQRVKTREHQKEISRA